MPTKTIPLFGSLTLRAAGSFGSKDQEFINCFPEVIGNALSGQKTVELMKREGSVSVTVSAASNTSTYGACVWEGKADGTAPAVLSFVKSTGDNVRIYYTSAIGTATQIGSDIANTSNCWFINDTLVSGVSNLTAVLSDSSSGAFEAWFFPEGGAWTQITDGDFPPNQGTPLPITRYIAHLDGYMFVMCTNGQIWNSDVNSLSAWTASSFITAQAGADNGTAIARYKDYIVAGGTKTIEFFYNAGNPTGSPLSPVANSVINVGVARANAGTEMIKLINNTLYFIGVDGSSGVYGLYRLNGMQAQKISTQAVDKLLSWNSTYITGIAGGFRLGDKMHILFTSAKAYNICYCIDNDFWWKLTLASQAATIKGIVTGAGENAAPFTFFNNYTQAANVYKFTPDDYGGDASSAHTATVRTDGLNFGTEERKFVTDIWLDADTQSSGTATLEASDDDYANWVTLGTFDMTKHEKRITRCGSFEGERAFRLTHSANTAFRARSIRVKYAVA